MFEAMHETLLTRLSFAWEPVKVTPSSAPTAWEEHRGSAAQTPPHIEAGQAVVVEAVDLLCPGAQHLELLLLVARAAMVTTVAREPTEPTASLESRIQEPVVVVEVEQADLAAAERPAVQEAQAARASCTSVGRSSQSSVISSV